MKPSSSDPVTSDDAPVVTARLDRQLAAGAIGHGWAHPQIEEQIARVRQAAVESARSEGYAAGWAQGRRAATQALEVDREHLEAQAKQRTQAQAARVEAALAVLADALARVEEAAVPAWDELADSLVDGAIGIARAVLARELGSLDASTVEALHTAVRCLGRPAEVSVLAHPDDVAVLDAVAAGRRPAGLDLVPDPSQRPGTLVTRTLTQRVATGIPAALAAAEEVLRA
jgi:flagellar assembly protein FliH